MTENPLQNALNRARESEQQGGPMVRNLVESGFHTSGLMLPPALLSAAFGDWLAQRHYHPLPEGREDCRKSIQDYYIRNATHMANPGSPRGPEASRILCTASSSESYSLLFTEFCEPGDNILLPLPSYPLFEDLAAHAGLEPRFYPLDPRQGWAPDLGVLHALVDQKTRFVVLISPNNPCGSIIGTDILKELLAICLVDQVMVIADEVFSEFIYPPCPGLPRPWEQSPGVPVFTLNGISKMYACPDLKLGWIMVSAGPDRESNQGFLPLDELVQRLALRSDTYLNGNDFAQFLFPRLLKEGAFFVQHMQERLGQARMDLLASNLCQLDDWTLIPPEGGIHCVLSHRSRGRRCPDDEALAIWLVQNYGLYLHPGYLYGMDEGCHLVLSLLGGFDPENWNRLAAALDSWTPSRKTHPGAS